MHVSVFDDRHSLPCDMVVVRGHLFGALDRRNWLLVPPENNEPVFFRLTSGDCLISPRQIFFGLVFKYNSRYTVPKNVDPQSASDATFIAGSLRCVGFILHVSV